MSAQDPTHTPIYAQLVRERGDVPTEVRRLAEQLWREVSQAMDFHRSWPYQR